MDDYFPIISCILISSVVACYCIRNRRQQRIQEAIIRRQQRLQEPVYVVLNAEQSKASAPPMQTVYDYEEGDPVV
jgi:flagellin-specific chaperone FliS